MKRKQLNCLTEGSKLRAAQRKEGRKEGRKSARCHRQPKRGSLDHAAHVGIGALPRIAKHGTDGGDSEIIKSAGWNDRMNRSPRRLLIFDCRVLSGPLAGPGHEAITTSQSPSISRPRPSPPSRAKFSPLLFQGYRRPFSDRRGRHHDLSIPTPIIIIIVIPGTGAMFRLPPTRTE